MHDDETAPTVTAFAERALDFFLDHGIVAERLMTDNAFAYIHNRGMGELLRRRAIRHMRTRPYTPRINGKVERYQQTLQREWPYALEYASSQARRTSLPHCLRHYNERRTHSALGNRPPLTRVREVTGLNSQSSAAFGSAIWLRCRVTSRSSGVRLGRSGAHRRLGA
jgi:hypothetical protein